MLRTGIIGCGALGAIHARRFTDSASCTVVALADPHLPSAEQVATGLPGTVELVTDDYRRLGELGLDIACIASPDAYHVDQVVAMLESGAHVLCEKPLTMSRAGLSRVLGAAEAANRHVSLTYPRRYDGGVRAMRREIQSGRWGPVVFAAIYDAEDWVTPNRGTWRHDPGICPGGFLYDAGGHQLDTLFWVTGLRCERVRATCGNLDTPVPMQAWGDALLTNGVPFSFCFNGGSTVWTEHVAIHCAERDFALIDGSAVWSAGRGFAGMVPIEPAEAHECADTAFIRLVTEGANNWAPPQEAAPVISFTEAVMESAQVGNGYVSVPDLP